MSKHLFEEITDESVWKSLRQQPDSRDEVKDGDMCYGLWFGDDRWWKFRANVLDYGHTISKDDDEMGLGFSNDDSCYDIGYAYHIVKIKENGK